MLNTGAEINVRELCQQFHIFTDFADDGRLSKLYISNDSDISILSFLRNKYGHTELPVRVSPEEINELIEVRCDDTGAKATVGKNLGADEATVTDSKIVARINDIIKDCIRDQASDIHFEASENEMVCRIRIDGILTNRKTFDRSETPEMLSRIKIMAGMDIAEKRRPQDGRIRFPVNGRTVDIRVSIIPTDFGEKAVLRILDKETLKLDLDNLGFSSDQLALFKDSIAKPNGIILVTGPTGSGKTTTLYAALHHLKSPEVNISTVEDPIEYNLEGINQTLVRPEINLTFSAMLRSLLRQDPNIIMVGEIRDRETLDIAIRTSLTGHLVLSTVHTNSAVATVSRLLDMGAEPYLLTSTLVLIVAQRLVRKVCTVCRSSNLPENELVAARRLGLSLSSDAAFGEGCDSCRETGYLGRTAMYELLPISDGLKSLIHNRAADHDMLKIAKNQGMRTMSELSATLVNGGITTPTEMMRELHV